ILPFFGYPLVSLLFYNAFYRVGHADQFPEHINAVMHEKALNYQVRLGVVRGAQVEHAPFTRVRSEMAFLDHPLRGDCALRAEVQQYIEPLGNLTRRASR